MTMPHINTDIDRLRLLRRRILVAVDAAAAIIQRRSDVIERQPDWIDEINVNVTRRRNTYRVGPCDTMDRTIEQLVEYRNKINEEEKSK